MIQLAFAGVETDGTLIYDWPLNALGAHVQRGITALIVEYPEETLEAAGFALRLAGLAGVVGAILYLTGATPKKTLRRAGELLQRNETTWRTRYRWRDRKSLSAPTIMIPNLEDIGISLDQSSEWQKLAEIPIDKSERRHPRARISINPEIQAKVRQFAQELAEQYGDAFQDPHTKTRVAAILRRCLPPRIRRPGRPGFASVSAAIGLHDELKRSFPARPAKEIWAEIYRRLIPRWGILAGSNAERKQTGCGPAYAGACTHEGASIGNASGGPRIHSAASPPVIGWCL